MIPNIFIKLCKIGRGQTTLDPKAHVPSEIPDDLSWYRHIKCNNLTATQCDVIKDIFSANKKLFMKDFKQYVADYVNRYLSIRYDNDSCILTYQNDSL